MRVRARARVRQNERETKRQRKERENISNNHTCAEAVAKCAFRIGVVGFVLCCECAKMGACNHLNLRDVSITKTNFVNLKTNR